MPDDKEKGVVVLDDILQKAYLSSFFNDNCWSDLKLHIKQVPKGTVHYISLIQILNGS